MSENPDLPEQKNRVLKRIRLMEFLGVTAARLTTIRRYTRPIPGPDVIQIDPQQHAHLRRIASERQTSVSALVAIAIHDWIAREAKPTRRKTARGETPRRTSPRQRKQTQKGRSKAPKTGAPAESTETKE